MTPGTTVQLYLSRLTLNPRSRQVMSELAQPYEMHRTLLHAFPDKAGGGPQRVLFRVETDRDGGMPQVLVQSLVAPEWSRLSVGGDYLLEEPEWKPFDPQFQPSQRLVFRLRANPTVKRDGKRHAWFREEDQITWLQRKACGEGKNATPAGFEILSVRVIPEGTVHGRKRDNGRAHDLAHFSVLFEGVLEVTHPEQLQNALAQGIGSGKAFGFGLLSLARVSQ